MWVDCSSALFETYGKPLSEAFELCETTWKKQREIRVERAQSDTARTCCDLHSDRETFRCFPAVSAARKAAGEERGLAAPAAVITREDVKLRFRGMQTWIPDVTTDLQKWKLEKKNMSVWKVAATQYQNRCRIHWGALQILLEKKERSKNRSIYMALLLFLIHLWRIYGSIFLGFIGWNMLQRWSN